jgi:hypothetical protein
MCMKRVARRDSTHVCVLIPILILILILILTLVLESIQSESNAFTRQFKAAMTAGGPGDSPAQTFPKGCSSVNSR